MKSLRVRGFRIRVKGTYGSGHLTHTLLECTPWLGTDPEGGWAGNKITLHLLKAAEKVSIISLVC
jgi:hypothetical protein